ncbi:hypothetical protein SDC9_180460 [bioreactor metagenome]|uniref:LysR substrate-binding domain-containing protein n=1 Tax=bioreactor metagenome TaxID=1076179 RepID=A0A645H1S0_9ZZZZ
MNNIVDGKFNLGIIRYQVAHEQYFQDFLAEKQLCSDMIWEFEYLVLMSRSHKLANEPVVNTDDLRHSIEIVHGDTVIPYLSLGKDKAQPGKSLRKRIYLYERGNQFELLSNILETFMWVSPIPKDMLGRFSLVQRKCDFPGNKYKDMLIYQKGYHFSELDKRFIDKIYASKNEVSFKEYN